jgi:hypothetical protein
MKNLKKILLQNLSEKIYSFVGAFDLFLFFDVRQIVNDSPSAETPATIQSEEPLKEMNPSISMEFSDDQDESAIKKKSDKKIVKKSASNFVKGLKLSHEKEVPQDIDENKKKDIKKEKRKSKVKKDVVEDEVPRKSQFEVEVDNFRPTGQGETLEGFLEPSDDDDRIARANKDRVRSYLKKDISVDSNSAKNSADSLSNSPFPRVSKSVETQRNIQESSESDYDNPKVSTISKTRKLVRKVKPATVIASGISPANSIPDMQSTIGTVEMSKSSKKETDKTLKKIDSSDSDETSGKLSKVVSKPLTKIGGLKKKSSKSSGKISNVPAEIDL